MSDLQELCEDTARRMADVVSSLRERGQDDDADEATRLHDAFVLWAVRTLAGTSETLEPLRPAPVVDLAAERERRRRGPPEGDAS